jgi:hypothetical protein
MSKDKILYRIDDDSKKRLILTGQIKDDIFKSDSCPFCGDRHTHGGIEGHRVAHCSLHRRSPIEAYDGTTLNPDDGYYIVDKNRKRKSLFEDVCVKCDEINVPELVYPINDGLRALYVCDNCIFGWRTYFTKKYPEFIANLV